MTTLIDKTGHRFGRLTVISRAIDGKRNVVRWLCKCDCGNEAIVSSNNLRNGTKSCKCIQKEMMRARNLTHGQSGHRFKPASPEYVSWSGMLTRCENKNSRPYSDYGGRGITVCEQWHDFTVFFTDMGPRPDHCTSIERIDNNGNYTPENCKWATLAEQAVNKRRCIMVTIGEEAVCLAEACRRTGMKYGRAQQRIHRGWNPISAIYP